MRAPRSLLPGLTRRRESEAMGPSGDGRHLESEASVYGMAAVLSTRQLAVL